MENYQQFETEVDPQRIGKFAASWRAAKSSWNYLMHDKEMMWFPFISGLTLLALLTGLGVLIFTSDLSFIADAVEGDGFKSDIVYYALVFLYYLVATFIVTFAEAGVITIVHGRTKGQDLTFRDGWNNAMAHKWKILLWSLISATVGMIIRIVFEKSKVLGKVIIWIFSFAWGIATFFIVPILVLEDFSIRQSIKESAATFKKTWGETLILNASIGLVFALGIIAVAILGTIGAGMIGQSIPVLAIVIAAVTVVIIILGVLASSVLGVIFRVVLYEYAKTGQIVQGFDEAAVRGALRSK